MRLQEKKIQISFRFFSFLQLNSTQLSPPLFYYTLHCSTLLYSTLLPFLSFLLLPSIDRSICCILLCSMLPSLPPSLSWCRIILYTVMALPHSHFIKLLLVLLPSNSPDKTIECLSTLLASVYWEVNGIKVFKDFRTRRDITIEFVAFRNCIIPRDDLTDK